MADAVLAEKVQPFLAKLGVTADERLVAICGLFKDRCDTLVVLAKWVSAFYTAVVPNAEEIAAELEDFLASRRLNESDGDSD